MPYARPVLPLTTFKVLCIRLDATSFPNSLRKRRVASHQGGALDIYKNMYRPFEQELSSVVPINHCVWLVSSYARTEVVVIVDLKQSSGVNKTHLRSLLSYRAISSIQCTNSYISRPTSWCCVGGSFGLSIIFHHCKDPQYESEARISLTVVESVELRLCRVSKTRW